MGRLSVFLKNAGIGKWGNTRAYNEEFSTEMYDKTFSTGNMPPDNSYSDNGVQIKKSAGTMIRYDGILAKSGAADVYAVIGRGSNGHWSDVRYYPMNAAGYQTFEALVPEDADAGFNLAFKDGADHWDNNSGMNYSFNKDFNNSSL